MISQSTENHIREEGTTMARESYNAPLLPLSNDVINYSAFLDELIDATAKLEVYKEKLADSKLNISLFLPTLQLKEAVASLSLEGTQATLDGVLTTQAVSNTRDQAVSEFFNYYEATKRGQNILTHEKFSNEFFFDIHSILMNEIERRPKLVGAYRKEQNYIGRNDNSHAITFVPPVPNAVPTLMDNLVSYINNPTDSFRPLVRTAIIHAQFESIHPFMDGNGRVGRILIPLYLFYTNQLPSPCLFVSEALEHNRLKYYTLLNGTRDKSDWNEWIKFFLGAVARQCDKYIQVVSEINKLYENHFAIACKFAKATSVMPVMNALYKYPITTAKQLALETKLPLTSINRLLNILVESKILYTNGKQRNRVFRYKDFLNIMI